MLWDFPVLPCRLMHRREGGNVKGGLQRWAEQERREQEDTERIKRSHSSSSWSENLVKLCIVTSC